MDLSKLPRLSNSEPPPAAPAPAEPVASGPAPARTANYASAPPPVSAAMDSWLSVAVGVILLLVSPRIWQYLFAKWFGSQFTWTFNGAAGDPLPYAQTVFFWGDVALAAFAISMVLEGLVIAMARKRATVAAALAITVVATLLNLGYVGYMLQQGYGFQIFSGLATAFGAYIAMYEWQLLQRLRE